MALTDDQVLTEFDILDVPYADSYTAIDGMGLTHLGFASTILETAKSKIVAFNASVEGTAVETEMVRIINEWKVIRWRVGSIQQGGSGDVQGLSFDWGSKRNLMRQDFLRRVPFYKYHEVLQRQSSESSMSGNVTSVQVLR